MPDVIRLISMDSGVYSTKELHRGGLTTWQIRREVDIGSLVALRHGWYATPTADPDVVSAVRAGGVLGCVAALRKHGLWVPPGYRRVHIRPTRHGELTTRQACRTFGPTPRALAAVDPVPIALLSAARCMTAEHWIATCDSVLNTAGLSVAQLACEMGRPPKHILALMERCDRRSQSGTESITRTRLRANGFKVVVQPQIAGVGHVDLRVGRLLLECDSVTHHTSLENYHNDRRRDRRALVDGWLTMRITYDDVLYGWTGVLADIRAITRTDRHRTTPSALKTVE
ncbi:very-short-patch-repair endonuclease [Williamsia limnetica]|uniref:Very-short-patch-repair endonuclease n=1 Tax=Williamsia limnetica TaxID=882452 RepID=A0A318RHA6_WILLI|nr:very-short-patch-repair endonuclease [Williamsia limnetica]